MTNIEILEQIQQLLKINQKTLGAYIGVSTRTINSWMTGERSCPDHVADLAARLAEVDAMAIAEGMGSVPMQRWAVIDTWGADEFITVCGSKADALREGANQWNSLTQAEKEARQSFVVGVINVQLVESGKKTVFTWAEGPEAGNIYDIAEEYTAD